MINSPLVRTVGTEIFKVRFYVCGIPLRNKAGRVGRETHGIFKNPGFKDENDEAADRCERIARFLACFPIDPPLPTYRIWTSDSAALLENRVPKTVLLAEFMFMNDSSETRAFDAGSSVFAAPVEEVTHESFSDHAIWQTMKQVPIGELVDNLLKLPDPTCRCGGRTLDLTFELAGKVFYEGSSKKPDEFREYIAQLVRQQ